MIAPDRALVKRWRTRVRIAVKASPAWRREKKRATYGRHAPDWMMRSFWSACAAGVLGMAAFDGARVELPAGLFMLWALGVTFFRAGEIAALTHDPGHLWVPFLLPLSDAAVFNVHRRRVLQHSLWLAGDALIFGIIVLTSRSAGLVDWLALPLLVLAHWAGALATAGALAAWKPRLPFGMGAIVLMVVGLVGFQLASKTSTLASHLAALLGWLGAFTPAGWVQTAFLRVLGGQELLGLGALAGLALGAILVLRPVSRQLRQQLNLERVFGYESAGGDFVAVEEAREDPPPASGDPEAIEAIARQELEKPPGLALFRFGYLERLITRALSLRLRAMVDFLQPSGLSLNRRWPLALAAVVGVRALHVVVPPVGDNLLLLGVIGTALAAVSVLPLFGGSWLAFSLVPAERLQMGFHAFYPAGYWPIARTVLAVNYLQIAMALPIFFLAAMFCFTSAPLHPLQALDYALRGLGLVAALQPLMLLFLFSQHTNDATARWWFAVPLWLGIAVGGLAAVAVGIALFAVETPLGALASVLALATYCLAVFAVYGFAWNRGWFDLVKVPRR